MSVRSIVMAVQIPVITQPVHTLACVHLDMN